MEGVLNVGDKIDVKLIEVDKKTGKLKLSRKVLLPKPEGWVEQPPRESRPPRRDDNRGGERRDDRRPPRDNREPRENRDNNNPSQN
jgi:polyribonucleotide nucleotidyltransferase